MKKLIPLLIFSVFYTAAYSQDSMNKRIENKGDKMNKKLENPNDPMNKKIDNVPDSVSKKGSPGNSGPLRRKAIPKKPVKKPVTR